MTVMKWERDLASWLKGSRKVLVMGIGNPLGGDDNLGNAMIDAMKRLPPIKGVTFLRCDTIPENFTGRIRRLRPDRVIIIDASEINGRWGEAVLIPPSEIKGIPISNHSLPINLLSEYVQETTGTKVMMLAVQPKEMSYSDRLSKEIEVAITVISKKLFEILSARCS
jgi:hydrogenase 3 maturation protease